MYIKNLVFKFERDDYDYLRGVGTRCTWL